MAKIYDKKIYPQKSSLSKIMIDKILQLVYNHIMFIFSKIILFFSIFLIVRKIVIKLLGKIILKYYLW